MNRDKDEFWAITDPDGNLLAGTYRTRVSAIIIGMGRGLPNQRGGLNLSQKAAWDRVYRQGYRARRVRVEVI